MESILLNCDCHSDEHLWVVSFDDEDQFVYISPHLSLYKNFLQRCWYALKYIFGYKSKYGCFDSIVISERNVDVLRQIVKFVDKRYKTTMLNIAENAVAVYPDSVSLELNNKNTLMAIFRLKYHAEKFGKMMWEDKFIMKDIHSVHFVEKIV